MKLTLQTREATLVVDLLDEDDVTTRGLRADIEADGRRVVIDGMEAAPVYQALAGFFEVCLAAIAAHTESSGGRH